MPSNRCSEPPAAEMTNSQLVYEVRPRKDHRGFDLVSDELGLKRLQHRTRFIHFLPQRRLSLVRFADLVIKPESPAR